MRLKKYLSFVIKPLNFVNNPLSCPPNPSCYRHLFILLPLLFPIVCGIRHPDVTIWVLFGTKICSLRRNFFNSVCQVDKTLFQWHKPDIVSGFVLHTSVRCYLKNKVERIWGSDEILVSEWHNCLQRGFIVSFGSNQSNKQDVLLGYVKYKFYVFV